MTRRGRAIVYWGLGGSVAAAAGPVIGGVLTQLDWRLNFFVNLPVGAAALLMLFRTAPSPRRPRPFDWFGQVSAVLALSSLTYGIIEGAAVGYESPGILILFGVCAASAVAFVLAQVRGEHPMVPSDLFRSPTVSIALAIALVTMAAFYGVVLVLSLYFQQQRGATPLTTGLLFLPMTGLVALLNPLTARLMVRYGKIAMIVAGQLLLVMGLVGLWLLTADSPTPLVALVMVPVGVGGSFTAPPIVALVLDHVTTEIAGTASGVINTVLQLGGSLSVAVYGALLNGHDFTDGLRLGLGATVVVLVLLAVSPPLLSAR
ncbi:tetracenomycin C resistance and export protein [Arthrobacter sp. Hiyo1]|nr:tetracenomycin C resistance and export protein [Arthrobacter sp. Hiyo1]